MTRSWMHGRLWANDPDCLLVRTDRTKMTLDEVRTMAAVIGLSGGMLLSSDDLDKVPVDRLEIVSMLVPPLPKSAIPADLMQRDMPERFEAAYERDYDPVRLVGLFNFGEETRDLPLDLPEGEWHVFELWNERYRGVCSGSVKFDLVEPHASKLVALRPATGRPQLIATDAHIGMGALDVTSQAYGASGSELTLLIAPVGKRRRKVWVAGGAPAVAVVDGRAVPLEAAGGGASLVRLDVDAPLTLAIKFQT
jgi:alpha-galactosidase